MPASLTRTPNTAIIPDRHFDRIRGYIDDTRSKGGEIFEINPANEDFGQQEHRRIAPTLILNATDDMAVMQDEIFGPLLPIRGYDTLDEVIDRVNAKDRPLAAPPTDIRKLATCQQVCDELVSARGGGSVGPVAEVEGETA